MKLNKDNINKYKMIKEKEINIFNIEKKYKEIENKLKEKEIKDLINEIKSYFKEEERRKEIEEYFKEYKYYRFSIFHILRDKENKEIIFIRNNNEKKFFINSHLDYFLNERKENQKLIDFENEKNEILINKNYIIFDYLKFDIEEK